MKTLVVAAFVALATVAAGPSGGGDRTASVLCRETPLFLWPQGEARPHRAGAAGLARLGDTFGVVSGPKSTLDGFQLYELNVRVAEPGYRNAPDEHYWIDKDCVSVR